MKIQPPHWTERSTADFQFRVAADFVRQIEAKLDSLELDQKGLAEKLKISDGRVSQVLNNPGNLNLQTMIKWSRALGMKLSILAYEDEDARNELGPIDSQVFMTCWQQCGKPRNFWDLDEWSRSIWFHPALTISAFSETVSTFAVTVGAWPGSPPQTARITQWPSGEEVEFKVKNAESSSIVSSNFDDLMGSSMQVITAGVGR